MGQAMAGVRGFRPRRWRPGGGRVEGLRAGGDALGLAGDGLGEQLDGEASIAGGVAVLGIGQDYLFRLFKWSCPHLQVEARVHVEVAPAVRVDVGPEQRR